MLIVKQIGVQLAYLDPVRHLDLGDGAQSEVCAGRVDLEVDHPRERWSSGWWSVG